jgi:hypothetical protein
MRSPDPERDSRLVGWNSAGEARLRRTTPEMGSTTPTTPMTHSAIVELLGGRSTDWLEKVSDEEYLVFNEHDTGRKGSLW